MMHSSSGTVAAAVAQEESADLYNGVGAIWLQLFGEHQHVGYYHDPRQRQLIPWRDAQHSYITALMDVAGAAGVKKVLDVGCGYGGTAMAVAKQLQCHVTGINISCFQVDAAQRLARQAGLRQDQVVFLHADGMAAPFPSASFDLVLAFESCSYMPDKSGFVQELARLARPGGRVLLTDVCRARHGPRSAAEGAVLRQMNGLFGTADSWASPAELRLMMEDAGLLVVADLDWTAHVRGFWSVGVLELLWRPAQGAPGPSGSSGSSGSSSTPHVVGQALQFVSKALRCAWLVLTGGWAALRMTWLFLSGAQRRVVQGALDRRVLCYRVILAQRPG